MKKIMAAWQQLPSPQITVAMASIGYDWVVVDLEHSSITTQEAEAIFIAAEKSNAKPFARLPADDSYLARRLLDAGACGVFVPVVEDLHAFEEFARHCYFPPKGKRGLGLTRANSWGEHLNDYFYNFKPTIIAQIETQKGASNIDEILKSEFLDGIMIGPFDLSASLGIPGQFTNSSFNELCATIIKKSKAQQKHVGFHQVEPDPVWLDRLYKQEYDFIAYGTDIVALRYALQGVKRK